ncbi:MAG: hypothetical protein IJZ85_04565 [Lachnospiraceae bacterium]|nr:hypothetical protein [Lachnospiraceae bacterium]
MKTFFYGWYLKCQSDAQTLAMIPAVHQTGQSRTCSIQIITEEEAWTGALPCEAFQRKGKQLSIGANQFGEDGIRLDLHTPELTAVGKLDFGQLTPLRYDIMGPFALVPLMECRHSVYSMRHSVSGTVCVNGEEFSFQNACGYWEGDRGRSFPKEYAWTQCFFDGGSLMLSVADIPLAGIRFTGVIAAVLWRGKEYRLATYLGARAVQIRDGRIRIVQGDMELEVCLLEALARPLKAPVNGDMIRTIHESAVCWASYRFRKAGKTLFEIETERASFEYEYPR